MSKEQNKFGHLIDEATKTPKTDKAAYVANFGGPVVVDLEAAIIAKAEAAIIAEAVASSKQTLQARREEAMIELEKLQNSDIKGEKHE